MKSLAIIDVDGTITDFFKIDKEIISKMFSGNFVISIIDEILWKINALDIITNRFLLFKIRIFLYSILSLTNYRKNMETYRLQYISKAKQYFEDFMNNEYVALSKKNINVRLLTCDPFDGFCNENVTIVQNKGQYILDNFYGKYDEVYIIGNNYMDDIKVGLKLKNNMDIQNNVKVFYVGSSSVLKRILKNKKVTISSNLKEVVKIICKRNISS